MNMIRKTLLAGLFALGSTTAFAGDIAVQGATAKLPLATGRPAAGYLDIVNGGKADDTLLTITIPGVERVELHEMKMEDGVMQMREMKEVPVKAGETVAFKRGGMHLMLFGVDPKTHAGETAQMTLTFRHAGKVTAPVIWVAK